jgi:ubiquinone/menaquinone biosynthesis C-methylase UbiE
MEAALHRFGNTPTPALVLDGSPISRRCRAGAPPAPDYLVKHYWWAYVHPLAVRFWDHVPLVNAILYGNYSRLRDQALEALGPDLGGRTLQMTCCYGDFSPRLAERVARSGGRLDVIDVIPDQLEALERKLPQGAPVRTALMDATRLQLPDAAYDRVVIFFLFHELPAAERARAMREALRVLKPGGTILLVDFGKPAGWHPFRYMWLPFLGLLEPFAWDVWNREFHELMPAEMARVAWNTRRSYFGGLFQLLRGSSL